jgi:hypothetical protein
MQSVRDLTIYDVISNNARLYPDRDCIVFNEVRLTHQYIRRGATRRLVVSSKLASPWRSLGRCGPQLA